MDNTSHLSHENATVAAEEPVKEARLWRDNSWTARVVKNADDEGWAVEMFKGGEREPALVAPWTMGRDKKNPKPLDAASFNTWVKTASEVLRRHEQQLQASRHKKFRVHTDSGHCQVTLDIVHDEYDSYAWLAAHNDLGEQVAQIKVQADFKLNMTRAAAWVQSNFGKP